MRFDYPERNTCRNKLNHIFSSEEYLVLVLCLISRTTASALFDFFMFHSVLSGFQEGDGMGSFGASGYHGSGWSDGPKAFMSFTAAEDWTSTSQGAMIEFRSTPIGDTEHQIVMMINGAGNVGIGTDSAVSKLAIVGLPSGKYPVDDYLDSLTDAQVTKITWVFKLIRELDQVPTEYFKKLVNTDNIWEVRADVGRNTFRILGFLHCQNLIILTNSFQKKSQKTSSNEISLAEKRKKDYLSRR